MFRFLIDVNLPYYFSVWHGADYVHVSDLNDRWMRPLEVPPGLAVLAGGEVEARPLEVDVAQVEPHAAAPGDLRRLVEVGRRSPAVAADPTQGGASKEG